MYKINQDPLVMEYFPKLQDKATTKKFIAKLNQHYIKHGYSRYAVELKATGIFMGFIGLFTADFTAHFTPATEIGWRLSSKHWGKGYATEGAKAILHYAFGQLKLKKIVSFTPIHNIKSRRVMEKIGLKHNPINDFDHPKVALDSTLSRHVLYSLTTDAYSQMNLIP